MASSGTQETKPEILSTYADQFRRIGALPGEYEIKIEHYPLKMVEEVAASMSEAKVFSALDATSGFYEIKLAEESTWLTTFNTLLADLNLRGCHLVWCQPQRFFKGSCPTCLRPLRNVKLLLKIC